MARWGYFVIVQPRGSQAIETELVVVSLFPGFKQKPFVDDFFWVGQNSWLDPQLEVEASRFLKVVIEK
jgi:hypothetical protein